MRSFHNIEKVAPWKKHYTGYANGAIYKITRQGNRWHAANQNGGDSFTRDTLEQVSQALETTAAYLLNT
jgi:hypothetical protein